MGHEEGRPKKTVCREGDIPHHGRCGSYSSSVGGGQRLSIRCAHTHIKSLVSSGVVTQAHVKAALSGYSGHPGKGLFKSLLDLAKSMHLRTNAFSAHRHRQHLHPFGTVVYTYRHTRSFSERAVSSASGGGGLGGSMHLAQTRKRGGQGPTAILSRISRRES
jgi:hypothetical protein